MKLLRIFCGELGLKKNVIIANTEVHNQGYEFISYLIRSYIRSDATRSCGER
jgi:hypothetical protein